MRDAVNVQIFGLKGSQETRPLLHRARAKEPTAAPTG